MLGCDTSPEDPPTSVDIKPNALVASQATPKHPPLDLRVDEKALPKVSTTTGGHDKMLATLQSIEKQTNKENFYLGERRAVRLRQSLKALGPDASDEQKCVAKIQLSQHELRLGNEREAIQLLDWVHAQLPRLQSSMPEAIQNRVRFRLAVAYMRFGETQNCCQRNTPESCILPIRGGGQHTREEGSRGAIRLFTETLEHTHNSPHMHRRARWLLSIAYMTLGEYPDKVPAEYLIPPSAFETTVEFPEFDNVASRLNLDSFDLSGSVVIDDFDNDDDLDIITSSYDTKGNIRFFRNNADGTFTDRTEDAGLWGLTGGLNMVQADYNNDGHLDVLVLRGAWWRQAGRHPNSLLQNQGNGTFRDVTFEAGLGEVAYPTHSAAWADYDNDGDLDLYVGNEHMEKNNFTAPSQLFRNNSDGTFTDVAKQAGVENLRYAKGVVWGDYNNDRLVDLYVSNIRNPNRLYRNNGDGTFTDVAMRAGVESPTYSFPAWFWDVDNDGILDLYVSSYNLTSGLLSEVAASYLDQPFEMEPPRLYRGDGNGNFTNVAKEYGLDRLAVIMGSNFGDLNGDGFLDFYLGTGYPDYEALMPNVMYLNQGGKSFVDVTTAGRFGHLQKGHGVAFADLDHDGDQDVFEQMGGAYPGDKSSNALYRNPGFDNHSITIQLVGETSNRSAIGARIRAIVADPEGEDSTRSIYKHVNSGGSFGANPLRQTLGLGKADTIERLEIYWPTTDKTQVFENVKADQFLRIRESATAPETLPWKPLGL